VPGRRAGESERNRSVHLADGWPFLQFCFLPSGGQAPAGEGVLNRDRKTSERNQPLALRTWPQVIVLEKA
jgi:hypothetical protein